MAGYTGTYAAFVRYSDGTPEQRWTGLRRTQAIWRYHWIRRNWYSLFSDCNEYGWEVVR